MDNPDDRVPQALTIPPQRGEVVGHGLSMLVEKVLAGMFVFVGKDIRIITVDEDVGVSALVPQRLWQQVCRPVHLGRSGCPGLLRVSIETVNQDDIDLRLGMSIDRCEVKPRNLSVGGVL